VSEKPQPIEVRKVAIKHVSDASGLEELIDSGVIEADRVVAVIGKTEGNGGVNDYTRIIADRAFREVLVAKGTRSAASGQAELMASSVRTRLSSQQLLLRKRRSRTSRAFLSALP
jgi:ring-opening amidohydrolase-like protein